MKASTQVEGTKSSKAYCQGSHICLHSWSASLRASDMVRGSQSLQHSV